MLTPERWQQVKELFHGALEREGDERVSFIEAACAGDEELRREVETLVGAHERPGSFIDAPAYEVGAWMLLEDQTGTLVGQSLGHYRVLTLLGAGGMGEVYLAEDTSLGRRVALKLLPGGLSADEGRLRRFEREARAASALNHPNILTIHEVGRTDSLHYIATEFVEGETLREHMTGTRMPACEVLDVAVQIASALQAAHEAGIVHRDVKPENVILRRDGYVKVIDFGVAKLTERQDEPPPDLEGPTRAFFHTDPGLITGTVSYMSPEQARGVAVDERTDLWSLGVVLYEMVAGSVPFKGGTATDVSTVILHREAPPLRDYREEVSAELERVVGKALAKDREERYQTAKDLLEDLRRLKKRLEVEAELERSMMPWPGGESDADGAPARAGLYVQPTAAVAARTTSSAGYPAGVIRRHKLAALLGLVSLVLVAAGGAYGLFRLLARSQSRLPPEATSTAMKLTRLTNHGKAVQVAVSPDGKYIAYISDNNGQRSLRVKHIATGSDAQVVTPSGTFYGGVTYSPDGNYIYYLSHEMVGKYRSGVVYRVPVLGGASRRLLVDIAGHLTVSPDGKRLAFLRFEGRESVLVVADAEGGGEQTLASRGPREMLFPAAWSPDGSRIACVIVDRYLDPARDKFIAVDVVSGAENVIPVPPQLRVTEAAWLADGRGLIVAALEKSVGGSQLWQLSYPGGEARKITNDLNGYRGLSLSADSSVLVTLQQEVSSNLWISPGDDPSSARPLTSGKAFSSNASWTPDGKIVYSSTAGGKLDIWLMSPDGTGNKRLSAGDGADYDNPSVSPDGRYIVFDSTKDGLPGVWRMNLDGGNERKLTALPSRFPRFSPDGKWVVYIPDVRDTTGVWKVPIDGGSPRQIREKLVTMPAISPDGRLIACNYWDEANALWKIALISSDSGQIVKIFDVPGSGFRAINWMVDGRAFAYTEERNGVTDIWRQPLKGGGPEQVTKFNEGHVYSFAWSRDGRQLAIARGSKSSDVVLITAFR
jgi:eukaryotic-like serine/threonine-protein kinase